MALKLNAEQANCNLRYNWTASMRKYFNMTGKPNLWSEENISFVKLSGMDMLKSLWDIRRGEDLRSIENSERYNFYKCIMNASPLPMQYLTMQLDYKCLKLLTQCRLNRDSIFSDKKKYEFHNEKCN